jgi:hypothetical protein
VRSCCWALSLTESYVQRKVYLASCLSDFLACLLDLQLCNLPISGITFNNDIDMRNPLDLHDQRLLLSIVCRI